MFFRFHKNGQAGKFINLEHVTYAEYVDGPDDDDAHVTAHLQKGSTTVVFDFQGDDARRLAQTLGILSVPFTDAPADKVV
jgi:hypothetical protein